MLSPFRISPTDFTDLLRFKASELGKGRKLMASEIEQTWQKLHNQSESKSVQSVGKSESKPATPVVPVATKPIAKPMQHPSEPVAYYSSWRENTSQYELTQDGKTAQRNHLQQTENEIICGQAQVSPSSSARQFPSSQLQHSRRIRPLARLFWGGVMR